MTIRLESLEAFTATAPVSREFREHLRHVSPVLLDPDDEANVVILSNGVDTAVAYRRCAGKMRAWAQFVEYLPETPPSRAARTVAEMAAWMFEHLGASAILASAKPGNDHAQAFSAASGASLVHQNDDEAIYQITGALH